MPNHPPPPPGRSVPPPPSPPSGRLWQLSVDQEIRQHALAAASRILASRNHDDSWGNLRSNQIRETADAAVDLAELFAAYIRTGLQVLTEATHER